MRPSFTIYSALTLAAMTVSLLLWMRAFRRDRRMVAIFLGALFGAVLGAKLVYLAAEGWLSWGLPSEWQQWAVGKSILGALLGGYAGVEIGKWLIDYRQPTGDTFAVMVPAGIAIGRIGCLLQGCCLGIECPPAWWTIRDQFGIPRWPAVPVEMTFNLAAFALLFWMKRRGVLRGQLFHLYLMAYGVFRFLHEPLRATPVVWHGLTGYQIAALLVALVGLIGFWRRRGEPLAPLPCRPTRRESLRPEKIQPTATNATVGCCSPQNEINMTEP